MSFHSCIAQIIASTLACTVMVACGASDQPLSEAPAQQSTMIAYYTEGGALIRPDDWRSWVYVGTPLTPSALNGGEAPFPEFHNVYVEPTAFAQFDQTGEWPEGTRIAKELVLVREGDTCFAETSACAEVSGVGYFQGEFQGLEIAIKDSKQAPDAPGGWAYYSFGHKPEPYDVTASAFPNEACNSCHETNAQTDFVFTQFYPVLRAAAPRRRED